MSILKLIKPRKKYTCSNCSKKIDWDKKSVAYRSLQDEDSGNKGLVFCSIECGNKKIKES